LLIDNAALAPILSVAVKFPVLDWF
jgi:hypothetical protein